MILYGIVDVSVNVHVQSNCKLPNNICIFILSLSKSKVFSRINETNGLARHLIIHNIDIGSQRKCEMYASQNKRLHLLLILQYIACET